MRSNVDGLCSLAGEWRCYNPSIMVEPDSSPHSSASTETTAPETPPAAQGCDPVVITLATGLGVGFIPFAPGTFGTVLGIPLAWALTSVAPSLAIHAVACVLILLVSCPICGRAARLLGRHDPGSVVLDEIAALQLVFLTVPFQLDTALIGFLTFRVFDITKPWPIRRIERLPGGWGIVADDAVAGLFAAAATWGIHRMIEF